MRLRKDTQNIFILLLFFIIGHFSPLFSTESNHWDIGNKIQLGFCKQYDVETPPFLLLDLHLLEKYFEDKYQDIGGKFRFYFDEDDASLHYDFSIIYDLELEQLKTHEEKMEQIQKLADFMYEICKNVEIRCKHEIEIIENRKWIEVLDCDSDEIKQIFITKILPLKFSPLSEEDLLILKKIATLEDDYFRKLITQNHRISRNWRVHSQFLRIEDKIKIKEIFKDDKLEKIQKWACELVENADDYCPIR